MLVWSVACAIVGLGFAAEAVGLYTHELNSALAVALLIFAALLDPTLRRRSDERPRPLLLLGAVGLAAVGLLLLTSPLSMRFFAATLWFCGLDRIGRGRGPDRGPSGALAVGCFVLAVYQFCSVANLACWYGVQDLSRWASSLAAQITGRQLSLGPTFSGLSMVVLAAGVVIGGFACAARRRILPLSLSLAAIAGLYVLYLCLFALTPLTFRSIEDPTRSGSTSWLGGVQSALAWIYPLRLPLLLPLLLAAPLGLYLRAPTIVAPARRSRLLVATMPAAAVLAAVGILAPCGISSLRPAASPKVAFFESGFLNWGTPSHDRYGSRSAGMFGNLPLMIERMGWQSEMLPQITDGSLAGKDILVIINQKDPLPAESLEAVGRFLDGGGSLLVLGDHTFWKSEKRLLLNEPLDRCHIRFRFDSADYFIGGWLHSLRFWPHYITTDISDATNECGSVVGASLEIGYPAVPLVVGRYGYSDPGDPQKADRGYLGNLNYDPGEMLGDVVLVAAEEIGRGRVIVAGDTSGFVNPILTQTCPYARRVFEWLAGEGASAVPFWRDVLGAVLLALLVVGGTLYIGSNARVLIVGAAASLAASWVSLALPTSNRTTPPLRGAVAVVDLSHLGRHSVEGWRDDGIAGLYLNLMRAGFFPIGLRHFDERQVQAADVFITIAPTRSYTPSEVGILTQLMHQGGTVILAAGWQDRRACESLLQDAGLRLEHRPLGRASVNVPGLDCEAMFWAAWPVVGGETVVSLRGEPAIVRKAVGAGRMIMIGDSEFLLNKNLEHEDGTTTPNVRFLSKLLQGSSARENG